MNDNFDLLISSGSVYLPNNKIEESDIGIKDSKILAIGNLQNKKYKTKAHQFIHFPFYRERRSFPWPLVIV